VGKLSFSTSYPYTLLRLTSVQGLQNYEVSSDLATITYDKFRAKVGCQSVWRVVVKISFLMQMTDNWAIIKNGAEPESGTTKLPLKARCAADFHPQIPVILYQVSVPRVNLTKRSYFNPHLQKSF